MCSAPNVYMFVYILIEAHMVPLRVRLTKYQQIHPDIPPAAEQMFAFLFTY